MRRKTRTITVLNEKYLYWYNLGDECTQISLSPKDDKTILIQIHFHNITGITHSDSAWFWELVKINATKNELSTCIKLTQPKFIADLIILLLKDTPDLFLIRNKKTVYEDGYALLAKMGYTNIQPIWNTWLW